MDITKSQAGWHMMACNTVISASRIHDKPFSQAIDVQGTRRDTDPPQTSNISWHSAPTDLQRMMSSPRYHQRQWGSQRSIARGSRPQLCVCYNQRSHRQWSNNRLVGVLSSHPHFDGKGIIIEWSVRKLGEWWHPRCFVILLLPLEYPGKRLNPRWSKQSIRVRFPWGMFFESRRMHAPRKGGGFFLWFLL